MARRRHSGSSSKCLRMLVADEAQRACVVALKCPMCYMQLSWAMAQQVTPPAENRGIEEPFFRHLFKVQVTTSHHKAKLLSQSAPVYLGCILRSVSSWHIHEKVIDSRPVWVYDRMAVSEDSLRVTPCKEDCARV